MSISTQDSGQSGTTGSGPQTIVENVVVPAAVTKKDEEEEEEADNSDWDSDVSI